MQYTFDSNVTANITLKAHWTPTATPTAITAATIENAKFNYQPGDAPQATAPGGGGRTGQIRDRL